MKAFVSVIWCLCFSISAWAIDRPEIAVTFRITEKKFTSYYGAKTVQLENRIRDSLTAVLGRTIPFFNFQFTRPSTDTLHFKIVREESATSPQFFDVYLQVTFSGKNVKPACQPLTWNFAPNGTYYTFLRSENEFVLEALKKIRELYNQHGGQIVSRLLSNRLITEHVAQIGIDFTRRQWKLPFTYGELQVGLDSKFKVVQEHNEQNQVVRKYQAEVKGVPSRDSRVLIEALPGGVFDGESFDDPKTLKQGTYRGFIGLYIIQLKHFYEVSIVKPQNSGIQ